MEVLVFGSANVDFMCYVERLPKPGETLHGNKFATGYGGKGANQCVAAARLGARCAMIAKLGADLWGSKYLENLSKEGVNVDFVELLKEQTTGVAQISVASSGENHIVIVVGANNLLSGDDVTKAERFFDSAKTLVCQLEVPVDATLCALQKFKGISILNAAPALANVPMELLKTATIFCVNESEASTIIGCNAIKTLEESKEAVQKLIELGANIPILTLGAMGVVYAEKENPNTCIYVKAKKVDKVVDTTGAGDAFIGSLAFFIARFPDVPLHQQIGAACEVSAYSVQYSGTQASFPTYSQVNVDLSKSSYKWSEL